jgi:hypothetical protein
LSGQVKTTGLPLASFCAIARCASAMPSNAQVWVDGNGELARCHVVEAALQDG